MNPSVALLGAARIRSVLDAHGVRPTKALGQNFVIDPNTIRKTISLAAIAPGERVVEVGPGAGSLTLGLAGAARRVIAIERDARLLPVLDEVLSGASNVEVVNADALQVDFAALDATSLVANLPYNIAATLVLKVLEEAPGIERLTVMVQREVGERLAAEPGAEAYGATSVLVSFFAQARVATSVSRNAFWPVPNVDSVIVVIERRPATPDVDVEVFFRTVKAAFGQRRKTLRNALAVVAGSTDAAQAWLRAAGIEPGRRAEDVAPADYVRLARLAP